MTLSRVPLKAAIKTAEHAYRRFDANRDADTRRQQIKTLDATGMAMPDIAGQLGISVTHARRIKNDLFDVAAPEPPRRTDSSAERCWQLEETVDTALDMACRIRDEDPQIVWDALDQLNRRQLQEFAVILLAGLPIDQTKHQLFGWVYDLTGSTETEVN